MTAIPPIDKSGELKKAGILQGVQEDHFELLRTVAHNRLNQIIDMRHKIDEMRTMLEIIEGGYRLQGDTEKADSIKRCLNRTDPDGPEYGT